MADGAEGGDKGAGGGDKGGGGGDKGGAVVDKGAAGGGDKGGAGAGDKPFFETFGLDDAGRDYITGKGFKTSADLVKSAMLSDKLVRDRNVIPAPDLAKVGEWEGYEKLGWTKDAKDYKIADAKIPDGLQYDKTMEAEFVAAAHAAKMPPHQTQAMRDAMVGMLQRSLEARTAAGARESAELDKALKAEWGNDYKVKSDLASRAARAMGLDLATSAELEKLTGSPRLVKLFAKIGETMSEDTLKGGGARAAAMTPESAAAEQRRLAADPAFMKSLSDPRHPQHKDNNARWIALIEAKVGKS